MNTEYDKSVKKLIKGCCCDKVTKNVKSNSIANLARLLEGLSHYDTLVSKTIDNEDISKEILLPKWKIWLLLRIFGEKKSPSDDTFAMTALEQFDDTLKWDELPFHAKIAAYRNNENFICAATNLPKELHHNLKGFEENLDDILDELSSYVPNKISTPNIFYKVDGHEALSITCLSLDKPTITIKVDEHCKTKLLYNDKEVYICKGKDESIMGPKWSRVMIAPIVAEVFKQLRICSEDKEVFEDRILEQVKLIENLIKGYADFVGQKYNKEICDKLRLWFLIRVFKSELVAGNIISDLIEALEGNNESKERYIFNNDDLDYVQKTFNFELAKKYIQEIHHYLKDQAMSTYSSFEYDKKFFKSHAYKNTEGKVVESNEVGLQLKLPNIFADSLGDSPIIISVDQFEDDKEAHLGVGIVDKKNRKIEFFGKDGVDNLVETFKTILYVTRKNNPEQ